MSFNRSLLVFVVCFGSALSLGGYRHRNRQNPSAYFSWGYGPHQRDFAESNDEQQSQVDLLEALLTETEASPEDGPCFGKRCTVNDKCCPGAVCVDMVGFARLCNAASVIADAGTCLPMYGARQGDPCVQDGDCAPGLMCSDSERDGAIIRTCHTERQSIPRKQYNERCETSNECNLERGMCCQIQRRHRQAPRKVCVYYKDPNDCIGNGNPLLEGSKLGPATSGRLG